MKLKILITCKYRAEENLTRHVQLNLTALYIYLLKLFNNDNTMKPEL